MAGNSSKKNLQNYGQWIETEFFAKTRFLILEKTWLLTYLKIFETFSSILCLSQIRKPFPTRKLHPGGPGSCHSWRRRRARQNGPFGASDAEVEGAEGQRDAAQLPAERHVSLGRSEGPERHGVLHRGSDFTPGRAGLARRNRMGAHRLGFGSTGPKTRRADKDDGGRAIHGRVWSVCKSGSACPINVAASRGIPLVKWFGDE